MFSSSLAPSVAPEYMPRSVEDVRLRMDRVLLGGGDRSRLRAIKSSGFAYSGGGDGGIEESVDAGVISNVLRGMGRCNCGISMIARNGLRLKGEVFGIETKIGRRLDAYAWKVKTGSDLDSVQCRQWKSAPIEVCK